MSKLYFKLIRPMLCVPDSKYRSIKVPIEKEENWYPEEMAKEIAQKYKHLENSFQTLVFDTKYEELKK